MYLIGCSLLALGLLFAVSGCVLTRYQWVEFPLCFVPIPVGILFAFVAAVVFLVSAFSLNKPLLAYLLALLGFLPMVVMLLLVGKGFTVPAIHDIATAPGELVFSHAPALRKTSDNALELSGDKLQQLIAAQQSTYGDLQPLMVSQAETVEVLFAYAVDQAGSMGWTLTRSSPPHSFEAVAETPLLRFRDDVLVVIREQGNQYRIDVRSASRVGKSDLGANYQRIKRFLAGVAQRL